MKRFCTPAQFRRMQQIRAAELAAKLRTAGAVITTADKLPASSGAPRKPTP